MSAELALKLDIRELLHKKFKSCCRYGRYAAKCLPKLYCTVNCTLKFLKAYKKLRRLGGHKFKVIIITNPCKFVYVYVCVCLSVCAKLCRVQLCMSVCYCIQVPMLRFLHNYLSKPCTIGQFANIMLLHCPVACSLEHSQ
jgi:hypothetical protein